MSVTARLSRLKDHAQGVARTSIRVAIPVAAAAVEKVRARWRRPGPALAAPAPERPAGPTPASVARNIAPHPPAPAPVKRRPPATPSGKLPPRRGPDPE